MNPDQVVSDSAKRAYAHGTQALAGLHYRLAELAAEGFITHELALDLQSQAREVHDWLYNGTLCAVRDYDLDDEYWDEADEVYSDGSPVRVRFRFNPLRRTTPARTTSTSWGTARCLSTPSARSASSTNHPTAAKGHESWGHPCSNCSRRLHRPSAVGIGSG
jgi:hypothetical protein